MRFLSHIRNFSVGIVEQKSHPTQYGDLIIDREGYNAVFLADDVTQADIEFAEDVFEKQGLVYGRKYELDEVTPVPLMNRLSVFDTAERALAENWSPEFRKVVEDTLLRRADMHPDFRLIDVEPIKAPWPRYLDFVGSMEQLLQKVVDDGYDVAQVLAYERQTGQRPQVIAALEHLAVAQQESQTAEPDRSQTVPA
jgi:hypothetical protein